MNSKWSFSIISWIISIIIAVIVITPIYSQIGENYDFYFENIAFENIAFVLIFLTFIRYIFLTKYHWFSHTDWVKVFFVFVVIPILLYVVDNLWDFQRFMDEDGLTSIMEDLSADNQTALSKYIKTEMTFFWAGAFVSSIVLPLRMINSMWRVRHRGKV